MVRLPRTKALAMTRKFYSRKPELVAKELLGKLLVRKIGKEIFVGKIVETEAYLGLTDKASHSYKGRTKRNEVMFGNAGHAYIYFTYGMHWLLNFVTEGEGAPSAVLIRAIEPLLGPSLRGTEGDAAILKQDRHAIASDDKKIANGPAKLTKWMQLDGDLNGEDVTKSEVLFVTNEIKAGDKSLALEKVSKENIVTAPRIGVDYAGEHKDLPLRFYIKNNNCVSKKS